MPAPMLALLAVPIGAATGWLTGKALEANGNAVLKDAKSMSAQAAVYIEGRRQEYEKLRNQLLRKLETYSAILAARIGNAPLRTNRKEPLPQNLQASWDRIEANAHFGLVFYVPSFAVPSHEPTIHQAITVANHQASQGHPMVGAAMIGFATAKRGFEYRGKCGDHRSETKAAIDAAKRQADESVAGMRGDIQEIEADWEELVTPILADALTDENVEALASALEWAKRIEVKARECEG